MRCETSLRVLLLGMGLCFRGGAQTPRFEAGVSLVHVHAEVLDANHRVLTALSANDFVITEEGNTQRLVAFAAEEQPVDLVLLFDTSRSMRGVVDRIASASAHAFHQLRPGDRVAVMVFNAHSTLLLPMTADLPAAENVVKEALVKERFGSGTKIQDAVADAGEQLQRLPRADRRRAILIVTDDAGIRTRREDSVVRELWGADASLNGVIVRDEKFTAQLRVAHVLSPGTLLIEAGMKGIAEKTGGDALQSTDAAAAFEEMVHRIRSRFSLYYRMPAARSGTVRQIKVQLSAAAQLRFPGATVRARHGYIVP